MKVSIIGGTGGMGKLIGHFLEKNNFKVFLLGRKSTDSRKRIKESDAVIFSIPIFAMEETLKSLKGVNLKDKLLIDLSSSVALNHKKIQNISPRAHFMHLMFGPDIFDLRNQNIITSDFSKDGSFKSIISVFEKEGANVTVSTADNHDYMMSIIQALSQFNSISLAKTISEERTGVKELDNFSSITFSLNTDVIYRIFSQKAELWSAIQFNNPFFKKVIEGHVKNIKELASYVENRDYKKFEKMFEKVSDFWKRENEETTSVKERLSNKNVLLKNSIGVLGPKGSYSEQAASEYSAKNKHVLFDSINEVITALSSDKISEAVLPLENSIHGTILETLDGLYYNNLKINKEIVVKIEHVIAGIDKKISSNQVKYIYSHPQALGQCKFYLEKNYPKAKLILTPSTSGALKKIKDEGKTDSLAIGSKFAANIYGLSIIDENIQDVKTNQTLFVAISKKSNKIGLPFTFLVIDPKTDRSGILHDILSVFKRGKVNLFKIESRPSTKELGKYIFYIKAEISSEDKRRNLLVKELKEFGKVTLITK